MDVKWHKIGLSCPKCDGQVEIQAISCSADSEIMADLFCHNCELKLNWTSTSAKLALKALLCDLEPQEQRLRPPLKEPPPVNEKQADKDWLHDLGIGGDQ